VILVRLAREVEVLRRCTDWLQRLERGENVVERTALRAALGLASQ